jgi:chromosomal replication initiation ATPase DnaA
MTFPPEVWDGVLRRLQARVAPISFDRWLSQIEATPVDEALELRCPTQFHSDRIRDYFLAAIEESVCEELGRRVPLRLAVERPKSPSGQRQATVNSDSSVSSLALPDDSLRAAAPKQVSSAPSQQTDDSSGARPTIEPSALSVVDYHQPHDSHAYETGAL